MRSEAPGRPNQKQRTRKDLLDAAARLVRQGHSPTLEEVAAEALVSRATAYRYFASAEAVLVEAAVHVAMPTSREIFAHVPPGDPIARVQALDTALHDMMLANEASLRAMLAHTVQRGQGDADVPLRQNRRSPLIAEALAPAQNLDPARRETLAHAIAALVGVEALVALKDVLQLDDNQSRAVKQWAIGALVEAARR